MTALEMQEQHQENQGQKTKEDINQVKQRNN